MSLFYKKNLWIPTWRGLLLILGLAGGVFSAGVFNLYSYLAPNHPRTDAVWLAVEGWLGDQELASAIQNLRPEQVVVATGGPVFFCGDLLGNKTYAELTAERLLLLGVAPEQILCAPAPDVTYDRTYASAVATRDALAARGLLGEPCNIYSVGSHSRRTLFLYKEAFGADYPFGIVALPSQDCDERHWWRSSLAFKKVFGEFVSWVYTLFSVCKYA